VSLQIAIRECGDVTIVDLCGRSTIDGGESKVLSSQLQGLAAKGVRKLLLNLADLTQLDSSGVTVIVRTYLSIRSQGGELKLLRPTSRVLDMFKVLHLLELLPTFENEEQAVTSFRPRGYFAKP
jgi:anti-anti-sigma factor